MMGEMKASITFWAHEEFTRFGLGMVYGMELAESSRLTDYKAQLKMDQVLGVFVLRRKSFKVK